MLGLPEKNAWRQWTYKADKHGGEQVGGMVTEYAGPLYFVTIKGAGHMVPQFKVIRRDMTPCNDKWQTDFFFRISAARTSFR